MGKTAKIVVCGKKGVGKTSILEQAIYGKLTKDTFLHSTIEDIYVANIETERGVKEHLRFYDTGSDMMRNINFFHADGFILVFDPSKADTLDFIMSIKKEIDRNKERKEVIITVMANHGPQGADPSTFQRAQHWAMREKIKIYEVSAMDRNSLYESFVQLASRLNQQVAKSSFGQLAMRKRD
ncbi:NF-kappa-B inhibitor-interacting Ras-like protein 2 [Cimex lectularius]|uniref:NF-kappa-B inhibitor-interacting Ras-like protein n=1 Tax=Cimex lectularius TaxID=79782 RepID=A0A8I6THW2_CIMLE|nr:NF-kappa-B inhibitor-interacting Ras-like protein 2 [Cimex lectularius]